MRLTRRERQVLQYAFDCDGDLREVGQRLGIETKTVRNFLHSHIFKKLMVTRLCGAIRVGLQEGFIVFAFGDQ